MGGGLTVDVSNIFAPQIGNTNYYYFVIITLPASWIKSLNLSNNSGNAIIFEKREGTHITHVTDLIKLNLIEFMILNML